MQLNVYEVVKQKQGSTVCGWVKEEVDPDREPLSTTASRAT